MALVPFGTPINRIAEVTSLNEVDPDRAVTAPVATEGNVGQHPVDTPPPSLMRSLSRGARTGFRWTSSVAGPLAAVELFLVLMVAAFGVGSGRGWPFVPGGWVLTNVLRPLVFFVACGLAGSIMAAVIALIEAVIRRVLPGSLRARWWAVANRPIRVFRRDGDTRTTFDGRLDAPPADGRSAAGGWRVGRWCCWQPRSAREPSWGVGSTAGWTPRAPRPIATIGSGGCPT